MDQQRYSRRRIKHKTNKCAKCINATLDDQWGEYKCKIYQRRISKPDDYNNCKHFKNNIRN